MPYQKPINHIVTRNPVLQSTHSLTFLEKQPIILQIFQHHVIIFVPVSNFSLNKLTSPFYGTIIKYKNQFQNLHQTYIVCPEPFELNCLGQLRI